MHKTTDKTRPEEIGIRNITNRNITASAPNDATLNFSFQYKLYLLKNCSNKIGVLVDAFKQWHCNAPVEDLNNIGGRFAAICKSTNNDYGYVLELIWLSVPRNPNGSHLNYLQGMMRGNKLKQKQPVQSRQVKTARELLDKEDKDNGNNR